MRVRLFFTSLFLLVAVAAGLTSPAQAAPAVFEGTLTAPLSTDTFGLGATEWDPILCPDAGPADGSFYRFIELDGDFKNLKLEGPTRLFTEPTGLLGTGDYDLDLYPLDANCQALDHSNGTESTESWEGKRPARFVVVHYYAGIHPNLPFKLQAANEKIK